MPGCAVDACRRRRDPLAAELRDQIHVPLEFLQRLLAARVVIDRPGGKADRALDGQSRVGDLLAEIRQRMAVFGVPAQVADPGLDPRVSGRGRHLDLFPRAEFLAHDRAGVQAVAERLGGCRCRLCWICRGDSGQQAGADASARSHQDLPTIQTVVHAIPPWLWTRETLPA
jgi:hypothetical protein